MNLFKQEDTIVALATGNIKSALAIIRISGSIAKTVVSSVFFTKNHNPVTIEDRKVYHGYIYDNDKKLDEVILYYLKAPHTYTGEDTVEISTHGNPLIVQKIVNLLLSKGIRPADKGEFTYRAFINNKMDLSEAEAVNELINSSNSKSVELALNSLQGSLSDKIKNIKQDLTTLFAYLEVSLDYPQEDIDFLTRDQKKESMQKIISRLNDLISSYSLSKLITSGIKIAIVGKPNAGKSSILNSILGYQRAIVTDIAGTTTDTIEETVEYNGISITIIDTAGIRYHTTNTIEKIGQERSKSSIEVADIILWITDSSIDFDDNDKQIADLLKDKQAKTIVVLNKSDLQQKISLTELKKVANINTVINFSTVIKTPIETILNKIFELMNLTDIEENTNVLLNTRQYNLICKVQEHLNKILELIDRGDSDEIVSFETQNALNSLNEILGIDAKEDILHTVFSKFCVGK
ncbi:tRNA uridine-5-carboxymethylaminomethyl(34) synthesis GTPase MnmE [Candidatus Ruminimicrobiellum ovillum]|uniref:tRNA uridine-5-carboxymethylaminomethyl(34) synthesis GTPase MnmE n=1 Tax=Candidatus Ruminimicrobiellum ovillum TaxID=1947927 RepID=UPI00355ABF34